MAAIAPPIDALPLRLRLVADLAFAARAAGAEDAAGLGLIDVGDLSLEQDARAPGIGIGHRRRREQRLAIGGQPRSIEALGGALLDDLAEIHDDDMVREIAHDREVVR